MRNPVIAAGLAMLAMPAAAASAADVAAAFGARQSVIDVSLSPDGRSIAYVVPKAGQGALLYTLALEGGGKARLALSISGQPDRLNGCTWVTNDRLVCTIYGVVKGADSTILPFSRVLAVDADGGDPKLLSTRENDYSRGLALSGGNVIDLTGGAEGSVLMSRYYLPDDHTGSMIGSTREGLGVDRINARTLTRTAIEAPRPNAIEFLSDGIGTVRIMGVGRRAGTGMDTGIISYFYHKPGSREWTKLGELNSITNEGFNPYAVDARQNVAYGIVKVDGRRALASLALDDTLRQTVLLTRPDVDIDRPVRIGRQQRVIGATYATERRETTFFDPEMKALSVSLGRALGGKQVRVVDASEDESKLLILADGDSDAGTYYLLDRKPKQMRPLLEVRPELTGKPLATVKPITYPARDGIKVPGYLTLPPGRSDARGLPAIVLPHGGPGARDEWGFDWLAQYFAAEGFAVLQPNFRGSAGYGDSWYQQNGFRSWRVAIGDVVDAGRWLVGSAGADPGKLAIVGWSYGGYAALQSQVVDPDLFKAVVAIAPVTDLIALKEESRSWSDYRIVSDFIGTGAHLREGSPAQNAGLFKAPVLLAHGTMDRNVGYRESTLMESRLRASGKRVELLTFEGLDHQLDDSAARAKLLARAGTFLKTTMGIAP